MAWRRRAQDATSVHSEKAQWLKCAGDFGKVGVSQYPEVLQEVLSFLLPTPSITSDDCVTLVMALVQSVPPDDRSSCPLSLEVLDKVIRSMALHLTPRNVDGVLGFLFKVIAACGVPSMPLGGGGAAGVGVGTVPSPAGAGSSAQAPLGSD
jgi:hypothetical protein